MTFSILTSEAFGVHFAFGLSLAAHTLCPPRTYTSSPSLYLSLFSYSYSFYCCTSFYCGAKLRLGNWNAYVHWGLWGGRQFIKCCS